MATFEMLLRELEQYRGSSPRPADFEQYWDSALAELDALSTDYRLVPAAFQAKGARCYDLFFTGVEGAQIHCKLVLPERPTGQGPGILMFHGYKMNSGDWTEKLLYATSLGAAVLAMDVRGQGGLSEDPSGGVQTLYGHVIKGAEQEDTTRLFYRKVYLDTVQAARILMSMDEVDENRVGVTGRSQGGGLSVACAALEPRIKLAAPVYPYLSDFRRVQEMDLFHKAYEQFSLHFRIRDPLHSWEDALFQRLGYIDIQNLAPRVQARVLWFTGLMDHTCPPSTQFAAYNKITSPKDMVLYPDYDHEGLPGAEDRIYSFFMDL